MNHTMMMTMERWAKLNDVGFLLHRAEQRKINFVIAWETFAVKLKETMRCREVKKICYIILNMVLHVVFYKP